MILIVRDIRMCSKAPVTNDTFLLKWKRPISSLVSPFPFMEAILFEYLINENEPSGSGDN